jgi:hypothetical protein
MLRERKQRMNDALTLTKTEIRLLKAFNDGERLINLEMRALQARARELTAELEDTRTEIAERLSIPVELLAVPNSPYQIDLDAGRVVLVGPMPIPAPVTTLQPVDTPAPSENGYEASSMIPADTT